MGQYVNPQIMKNKIRIEPYQKGTTSIEIDWNGIAVVNGAELGLTSDEVALKGTIHVRVSAEGVNVSATGTLSDDGIEALEQAIAIAKALRKRNFS